MQLISLSRGHKSKRMIRDFSERRRDYYISLPMRLSIEISKKAKNAISRRLKIQQLRGAKVNRKKHLKILLRCRRRISDH